MSSMVPIGIVIALIISNGFFVAAEFALIGAPKASIERRAKLGDRIAEMLRAILHDQKKQDQYIATAQLGITLSSLGLGMYGEHVLALWLESQLQFLPVPSWIAAHSLASGLSIVFLTYLHIVIGEMVPKSLALQKAEKIATWVTPMMRWLQIIFYPLVIVLNGIGNGILNLIGVRRSEHHNALFHTSEELEFVIRESHEGGLLRSETSEVLQELLEFSDLLAREVMVPRVKIVGIPVGAANDELVRLLEHESHTRYPLFEGDLDHIVGSVHIKDFLKARLAGSPIEKREARAVPYIPESATLEQVLGTMRRHNAQMVVVMDEHGGTAGLITIEDLFEEIVGDIEETESGKLPIRVNKDGSLDVDGTVRLDEVEERLGVELEHETVDTVGGLILNILGRPPRLKDEVKFKDVCFAVTAVEGHGVGRCRVAYDSCCAKPTT